MHMRMIRKRLLEKHNLLLLPRAQSQATNEQNDGLVCEYWGHKGFTQQQMCYSFLPPHFKLNLTNLFPRFLYPYERQMMEIYQVPVQYTLDSQLLLNERGFMGLGIPLAGPSAPG